MMTQAFDTAFARERFPALDTPWVLFDNAGGSLPAQSVIRRVSDYMGRLPVQLGASYELSAQAREAVEGGRAAAAALMNAEPGETILGSSATQLVALMARALRPLWREGDEVIVTDLDHEANIGPWRALESSGVVCREWRFREGTGELELEDLEPLLSDRTRLVAFTHCSNIVGTIHDVKRFAARIREAGALSCVDGVAYAPHRTVDVKDLGVDFYFASLYKIYGPHLGMLYGRRELLARARSQNHFFVSEDQVPVKLEPGNSSYELAASLTGIVEYLEELAAQHGGAGIADAFARIAEREEELVAPLMAFLHDHPRVTIVGRSSHGAHERVPTVSFIVDGMKSSEVPRRLEEDKIAARHGHFYAYRIIERLGLMEQDGVVRVSLLHYNTEEEVARLMAALERIL